MKDETTFGRILGSLHDAALDRARWPGFSAVVDDGLDVHGQSLILLARGLSVREVAAATGRRESTRQADLIRLVRSLAGVEDRAPGTEVPQLPPGSPAAGDGPRGRK
ncbi:MAG: hypothetical protein F4X72_07590 [Dehalococcoidia bacterium]|nr:hypothetical protein [Dehalococcoidia bacterium]